MQRLVVASIVLFVLGSSVYPGRSLAFQALASGAVAAWHLNETNGQRNDSLGSRHLADNGGVSQAVGQFDNAALFNPSQSQSLSHLDHADLSRGDTDWTYAVWFKLTSGGAQREIIAKQAANQNDFILRYENGDSRLHWYVFNGGNTIIGSSTSVEIVSLNVWHSAIAWHDAANNQVGLQLDGAAALVNSTTGLPGRSAANFRIGARDSGASPAYWNGAICEAVLWSRVLSSTDRAAWWNGGTGNAYPFGAPPPDPPAQVLMITAPSAFQVFQRSDCSGTITITGSTTQATNVEARYRGSAWANIASNVTGSFSGQLTKQFVGQGNLEIRASIEPAMVITVNSVGIGDVYLIAGQSNASGRASNLQVYSHPSLKAGLFGNDYLWHELFDATDSGVNQADLVSADSPGGSVWPLLATSYMTETNIPVAFVPCAKGATSITAWLPSMNHQDRSTLYGSMVSRGLLTGCKAVLWWQGESDGLAGMSQATYHGHLATIANALKADLNIKLIPCKLQNSSGITDSAEQAINDAIGAAWLTEMNVLTGPDLSDLASDDSFHLATDVKIATAAGRWWSAVRSAFGL